VLLVHTTTAAKPRQTAYNITQDSPYLAKLDRDGEGIACEC
jgi:hypothetical protein